MKTKEELRTKQNLQYQEIGKILGRKEALKEVLELIEIHKKECENNDFCVSRVLDKIKEMMEK